ncbi:carbohydrate-binding protein [Candidatus Epulonipiscium viviparus]|uniref:carbohydrate-binding protein n=1 Tax=Candidatus Epulonipiscium viviparus TaxID=420336 RepID=UPI0027380EA6|nr:carbohydrate-binding protein [Candidatus Epulopiscium viviparus]
MNKKFRVFAIITGVAAMAVAANFTSTTYAATEVSQQTIGNTALLNVAAYSDGEGVTAAGEAITIDAGGWVKFTDVDFGSEGLEHFAIDVSTQAEVDPSSVRVFIDSMDTPEASAVRVEMFEDQEVDFRVVGSDFATAITGVHDVYIKVDDAVTLNWVRFTNVVEHKIDGLSGVALASSIQSAIDKLNPYDVLELEGATYEMGKRGLNILKPMTLRGAAPATDAYKSVVGASELTTILDNSGTVAIKSDDVRLEHMAIMKPDIKGMVISVRVDGYPNTTNEKMFTGFALDNVRVFGGMYAIHTGNGAQVLMTNSSLEGFSFHGLILDRRIPVEVLPQLYMDHCFLSPYLYPKEADPNSAKYRTTDEYAYFNAWSVGLDAGNDEYIVRDLSNTVFQNNTFLNTGIGIAKGANAIIRDNTFTQYCGNVEMLHFEEFTNNILIENNRFEGLTEGDRYTSPGIGIDREMQSTFDITFRDNTIVGAYARFFNAYSPQGITIENNDFTQAYTQSIQTPNGLIADTFFYFTWNALEHHLDNMPDVGAKNVVIRDNKFSEENLQRNKMTIEEYAGETSNYIQPELIVKKTILDAEPEPLVPINESYRIVNKATGQYLYVKPGDEKIYYTDAPLADGSDVWKLGLERNIYYTLQNQKEGKYLEVKLPYTASHMENNTKPAEIHAKVVSDYEGSDFTPIWFFVKEVVDGVDFMLMHPGYSECRSRLTQDTDVDHAFTEVARISKPASYKPFEDADLWEFVPVNGTRAVPNTTIAKSETAIAPISFEAGEVVNYKVTGVAASAAVVTGEGVADGSQAIRVEMKERQDNVENAAKLIVSAAEPWDLGIDKTMFLTLTNPNNFKAQIRVSVVDAHGNTRGIYYWMDPKTSQEVEIGPELLGEAGIDATKYSGTHGYFGKGVDPAAITQIQVFFPENNSSLLADATTGAFIVDNIYGFIE